MCTFPHPSFSSTGFRYISSPMHSFAYLHHGIHEVILLKDRSRFASSAGHALCCQKTRRVIISFFNLCIMDVTLICKMFEDLPRQGPGADASTAQAWSCIPPDRKHGKILDIGCGSGMQTLALARLCPDCRITAVDIHQPFLDDLIHRAKNAGLDTRIVTYRASMDNLSFNEASFDIIWSEGSAFIMGLSPALRYWKKFLQPEGYLVVSDCTWFTDAPSEECRAF